MNNKTFRCIFQDPTSGSALSTGIYIDVPSGLTRQEAVDYVTGICAREISRYAAWEALCLGATDRDTDWKEIVT